MLLLLSLLASVLLSRVEGGEIYGGAEAKPHSRPYMAYVSYIDAKTSKTHRCGGVLVKDNFVLTAAHCFGRNMIVTLGAHNIRKTEFTRQIIPVLRAFPHQHYDARKHINDIMLLKLKFKARLTFAVQIIPLPHPQGWVKPGQVCSVAGWGIMANGYYADTLQEVYMEVQDEQKCKDLFKNMYNNSVELCVGNPNSKKSTGIGDSGGPFVCNGPGRYPVVQGIVSYADQRPGVLPRVFTRISGFLPFIYRILNLPA